MGRGGVSTEPSTDDGGAAVPEISRSREQRNYYLTEGTPGSGHGHGDPVDVSTLFLQVL